MLVLYQVQENILVVLGAAYGDVQRLSLFFSKDDQIK